MLTSPLLISESTKSKASEQWMHLSLRASSPDGKRPATASPHFGQTTYFIYAVLIFKSFRSITLMVPREHQSFDDLIYGPRYARRDAAGVICPLALGFRLDLAVRLGSEQFLWMNHFRGRLHHETRTTGDHWSQHHRRIVEVSSGPLCG